MADRDILRVRYWSIGSPTAAEMFVNIVISRWGMNDFLFSASKHRLSSSYSGNQKKIPTAWSHWTWVCTFQTFYPVETCDHEQLLVSLFRNEPMHVLTHDRLTVARSGP